MPLSPSQLEEQRLLTEVQTRKSCRDSFLSWATYLCSRGALPSVPEGATPALHHRFIIQKLQDVVDGKIRKLIILVPPGAGKSVYSSMAFPTYYLNRFPNHSILACSCTGDLATSFGRQCRNIIDENQNILGFGLSKYSTAADEWETDKKGRYFCAGVGGKIASRRASLALIDDYMGKQDDVDSERMLEKVWSWYWNDFWPRLWPNAPIIIIANRRHEEDLVGRLLAKEKDWVVISLPMVAEDNDPLGRAKGERLWPEWYTEEQVATARSMPQTWAGLYQQHPSPEEGAMFLAENLVTYTPDMLLKVEQAGLCHYCFSDHALKEKEQNDPTLLVHIGLDSSSNVWVFPDWFWKKADTLKVAQEMLRMAKSCSPIFWKAGAEHITGSISPFLYKMMQEQNVYFNFEEIVSHKDKVAKCGPILGRVKQRKVFFPGYSPDWGDVRHELLSFPNGKHDEWPDVLGEIGRALMTLVPASAQAVDPKPGDDTWRPTVAWVKRSDLARRREVQEAASSL